MQPSLAPPPDFAAVYRANYGFVWRTLRHFGVEPARLDDAVQDTFLVVHRRLADFAGRAAVRTWLFEIARRVASRYRRSAAREAPRRCSLAEVDVEAAVSPSLDQAEAAAILHDFLDGLDRDQAVVFVLTELEQWQAPEIAAELGVNLNTVYSRLRAARRELDRLVRRLDARDRRLRPRRGAQVLAALAVVEPPVAPPWQVPAHASDVLSDMSLYTWSIEPVARPAALALAGSNTAVGLSFAGLGIATLLVFGRPAQPAPEQPASAVEVAAPASRAPIVLAHAPKPDTDTAPTSPPAPANPASPSSEPTRPPVSASSATPSTTPSSESPRPATSFSQPASPATSRSGSASPATPHSESASPTASTPSPASFSESAPSPASHSGSAGPATPAPSPASFSDPAHPAAPRAARSLAAELALVESIRAALLAGDDRGAIDLAARHRRHFPAGEFAQEAAAAAIEARCRLGERARARREATRFVARWPDSPLVARVDALCREHAVSPMSF